jgi:SAM-dependent methyltransferase
MLKQVLDLGHQPPANDFISEFNSVDPHQPRWSLELCRCDKCGLLQLRDSIEPAVLFDEYLYFTSASRPMVEHAKAAADRYISEYRLNPDKRVLEIASNDGYFLRHFLRCGAQLLGIEPAMNVAAHAIVDGIPTLVAYFGKEFARRLAHKWKADLVLGNNVLAHAPDIRDFVAGVKQVLAPNGVAIFEFPYALQMIERTEFDTIYHEHVFYFTLGALDPIFERAGLELFHVEHLEVHGGAIRIFVAHQGVFPPTKELATDLLAEISFNRSIPDRLAQFRMRTEKIKEDLRRLLADLKSAGRTIAAYGASAKGTVLLNYCDIGSMIDFITDTTPAKQGKFSPGTGIPIVPPDHLLKAQPDYCLLLIWNFQDQVLKQEAEYIARGGRFIVAIPEVQIL